MLNLINLLSERPAPVKHSRLVRGYAMSGSKELTSTEVAEKSRKAAQNEAAVVAALVKYGPMRAVLLCRETQITEKAMRETLRRLQTKDIIKQVYGSAWMVKE